jgi:hypothetical protein
LRIENPSCEAIFVTQDGILLGEGVGNTVTRVKRVYAQTGINIYAIDEKSFSVPLRLCASTYIKEQYRHR